MSAGDWVEWDGRRRFKASDAVVRVRFRNGRETEPAPIKKWNGRWLGSPFDIIAVQVVPSQD